jgi:hypothetical protein
MYIPRVGLYIACTRLPRGGNGVRGTPQAGKLLISLEISERNRATTTVGAIAAVCHRVRLTYTTPSGRSRGDTYKQLQT